MHPIFEQALAPFFPQTNTNIMQINFIYDQQYPEAKKPIAEWAKAFHFQNRIEATVWNEDTSIKLEYEGLLFYFHSIGKPIDDNKCVTQGTAFPCRMRSGDVVFDIPTFEALQTIVKAITNEW